MGCDIHVHIEYKINGEWHHYAAPSVERWYDLFSIMAGVRGQFDPIVPPRGVPHDATFFTKWEYEYCGTDAHNASYLIDDEIIQLEKWITKQSLQSDRFIDMEHTVFHTYIAGHSLTAFLKYDDAEYAPAGTESVRIVFWFDN